MNLFETLHFGEPGTRVISHIDIGLQHPDRVLDFVPTHERVVASLDGYVVSESELIATLVDQPIEPAQLACRNRSPVCRSGKVGGQNESVLGPHGV